MKPTGPIPEVFARAGRLRIGGRDFAEWTAEAGDTPLFVYAMDVVRERVAALRRAMPAELGLHYAVKANPHPVLLAGIAPLVDGLDVASAGELARGLAVAGGDRISFAGPGKRDRALEAAIVAGATLNAESGHEVARAVAIGRRLGTRPRIAVRVNPDFELRGSGMRMGGRASPFGIDAALVPDVVRAVLSSGAEWRGFHIFAGSQTLDPEAIAEAQRATVALAAALADAVRETPPAVNLGGGFGIPYFAGDRPLDPAPIGRALDRTLADRPAALRDTAFAIELGRYLVGEAGVYLTRVVDLKESGGERFVVVDGGLHHQLAATGNFGTVVRRNYPVAVAERVGAEPTGVASIVGCLCTPLDRLADRVALPPVSIGDTIAVFAAGAYGRTASPETFLGHPPPIECVANT